MSFIKREIKEKKKNSNISFSSRIEPKESNKTDISNNYDHKSGETYENSDFEESSVNEDSSSDMSCEEEITL